MSNAGEKRHRRLLAQQATTLRATHTAVPDLLDRHKISLEAVSLLTKFDPGRESLRQDEVPQFSLILQRTVSLDAEKTSRPIEKLLFQRGASRKAKTFIGIFHLTAHRYLPAMVPHRRQAQACLESHCPAIVAQTEMT